MLPVESNRDAITAQRVAHWKAHYAKEATAEEFDHYVSVCRSRGLNPEAKQIYFVKVAGRASILMSIDAYRLIAQRTGAYAGIDPVDYEFNSNTGKPVKATIRVQKMVQGQICNFSGAAYFSEFYKPSKDGKKSLWDSMPLSMLEKCAEAKALRKAFPEELAAHYIKEEMIDAEAEQAVTIQEAQQERTGANDIVVTSEPKIKDWLKSKLQQAKVPEGNWADIIESLNGCTRNELTPQLKKAIAECAPTSARES